MHTAHRLASSVTSIAVMGSVALGCASKTTVKQAAAPQPASRVEITSAEAPRRTQLPADVVIAPDIRALCHIEDVASAPKFDFDRAELRVEVREPLQQLAECLTTGPLKGQKVVLTGRADPRGEEEYNMVLGSSRASSVGDYLRALGVAPTSLSETSRGELDSRGIDEATWQLDRRVDIQMAR